MLHKLIRNKLDERQLIIRGNVFFRTLLCIVTILMINFFFKQLTEIHWIVGDWDYMLLTMGGSISICIQLLYYGIYPWFNKKYHLLFWGIGIYGFTFMYITIFHYFKLSEPLITKGHLSEKSAFIIFSSYFIIIFIVYLVFAHQYKIAENKFMENED